MVKSMPVNIIVLGKHVYYLVVFDNGCIDASHLEINWTKEMI